MVSFFQVTLRTSDVEAARGFYARLLGEVALDIVKLHEQTASRGARPHWLGLLDVGDVDKAAAEFVARGATPLAPKWVNPVGLEAAVIRDPGGAIVALAKPAPRSAANPAVGPDVAWYVLNTVNIERAQLNYGQLLGWEFKPFQDLGDLAVRPFSWQPSGPAVGCMLDTAPRPEVHPHWLFHFRVPELAPAMDIVRAAGGTVLDPLTLPSGEQTAVCEDPQGAAFALWENA